MVLLDLRGLTREDQPQGKREEHKRRHDLYFVEGHAELLTPGYEAISKPIKQDMPRPGGFPPVRYRRDAAPKGASGLTMFVGGAAIMAFGMYRVGQGNIKRREEREEKLSARRDLVALLQAEEDRRYVKAKEMAVAREAEIMKDVPEWKVGESVYHGDRWMPPATQRHI